jgi:RNA polymerase sigma-70 factor (ECF subfamily)
MDAGDEQAFIAQAKQGDDSAYERLLGELILPAHKLACGLLHDTYLAEDAVQEASVKGWRKIGNVRPGAPLRPWFLRIVVNECRDVQRRRWSRLAPAADPGPASEAFDEAALDRMQVRRALERLNKDERLVVVLHYYVGLPWADIAAVSGLSESGARTRLFRAINRMRATKDLVTSP